MEGDLTGNPGVPDLTDISIHTLRMEGDFIVGQLAEAYHLFQSTPSAWRVTTGGLAAHASHLISIHTLRMEGDRPQAR